VATAKAMKKILSLILLLLGTAQQPDAFAQTTQPRPLAFTHVTVIDATDAPAKPGMTVVVIGDHIAAMGRTGRVKIPANAEVIDAAGKFLIPGLWDMHVHLTIIPDQAVSRELMLRLLVAYGVTGVRDMGGDWRRVQELRREIAGGKVIGPRIVAPGPFVDGPQPPGVNYKPVSTEDEARQAVRALKAEGVDFIKVQAGLSPTNYAAVIDEAKRQAMTVAGHAPEAVSALTVARSGQRSVEHVSPILPGDAGIMLACSSAEQELRAELLALSQASPQSNEERQQLRRRQRALQKQMVETYDAPKCDALLSLMAKNRVYAAPTQIWSQRFAPLSADDLPDADALPFVPLSSRAKFEQRRKAVIAASTPEDFAFRRMLFERSCALVGALHRARVPLLAGTDAMDDDVLPGLSLHRELALMVEAGLTPLEALQTATRNAAQFLGKLDSQGTIERGKVADLVLLDADPLQDIANTRRIHAVVIGGRLISQMQRRQILAEAKAFADKH
jgi:imidazolonepropionase-like amidohydrolase